MENKQPQVPKNNSVQQLPVDAKPNQVTNNSPIKTRWQEDQEHGARLYKVTGYTTVNKINAKYSAEYRQRFMRKLMTIILLLLVALALLAIINPFGSLGDFRRVIGLDSKFRDENHVAPTESQIIETTIAE